jgi:hypothetical protein
LAPGRTPRIPNAGLGVPAQEVDATLPEICSRPRAIVRLADLSGPTGSRHSQRAVLVSVVMILRLHVFLYLIDEPIYVLYVGLIAVAACFTALRLSRRSANRRLALIGCSLALLGCLIFLCIKVSERWLWPLPPWQVYSFLVGAFCLALGGVVLFVGLLQPIYEIC